MWFSGEGTIFFNYKSFLSGHLSLDMVSIRQAVSLNNLDKI